MPDTSLKDQLEIILITYNRCKDLEITLQTLLGASSPVKDISITVLDNCSTDNTPQILAAYTAKYPNLRHIRNGKNIGSNANICRIFELAQKPYVWPLCDDDDLHWEAWPEVQQAINAQADAIVVNTEYTHGDVSLGALFRLVTFLPSCIYKTALIDNTVLFNTYNNIPNWFPHLALMAKVLNSKGTIAVTSADIVTDGQRENNRRISLGKKEQIDNKTLPQINQILTDIAPSAKHQFIEIGYYKSCELLEDKNLRAQAVENCLYAESFSHTIWAVIKKNWMEHNGYAANTYALFPVFNTRQKLIYIFYLLRSFFAVAHYRKHYKKHLQKLKIRRQHYGK